MKTTRQPNRTLILVVVLLILLPALVLAGGQAEPPIETESIAHEQGHDEDHASEGDSIPHVDQLVQPGERLRIVATTSIVADVLRNVVADAADILILVPLGQNPHSYEPTPGALRSLGDADLVFANGFGLEEGLLDDLESVAGGPIVPVSAGISVLEGGDHDEDDHDSGDPHTWMDPNNVIVWVKNMVEVLGEADPANAELYRKNGEEYIGRLLQIDEFIRTQVATIPETRRRLVVDHESISYFADEYGFELIATIVPGTSDRAEPSAQEIARLVDVVRNEDVSTIFVGRTASRSLSQLAQTIASEVGRQVQIVQLLTGSLTGPGEEGDTYLAFLRYNVAQIIGALGE